MKSRIGRPPTNRPRRVSLHTTVSAETLAAITADSINGESQGQTIDRWARERKYEIRERDE